MIIIIIIVVVVVVVAAAAVYICKKLPILYTACRHSRTSHKSQAETLISSNKFSEGITRERLEKIGQRCHELSSSEKNTHTHAKRLERGNRQAQRTMSSRQSTSSITRPYYRNIRSLRDIVSRLQTLSANNYLPGGSRRATIGYSPSFCRWT